MAATAQMTLEEIRRGLSWRKQLDKVFVLVGLAVLFACLAILALLAVVALFLAQRIPTVQPGRTPPAADEPSAEPAAAA